MRVLEGVFQRRLFTVVAAVAAVAGMWSMAEALEMEKRETAGRDGLPSIDAGRSRPTETATFALG
jgi:hypothetical protein